MTRPIICAAVVVAVLAIATTALRSHHHPADLSAASAAMMPLQDLHAAAARTKLPAEDFEDMSLIYPTGRSK